MKGQSEISKCKKKQEYIPKMSSSNIDDHKFQDNIQCVNEAPKRENMMADDAKEKMLKCQNTFETHPKTFGSLQKVSCATTHALLL